MVGLAPSKEILKLFDEDYWLDALLIADIRALNSSMTLILS